MRRGVLSEVNVIMKRREDKGSNKVLFQQAREVLGNTRALLLNMG